MKIAVLGASCTKFGELWNMSLQDLLAEAQLKALKDAHIGNKEIDAIFTGNMCAGMFSGQLHLGSMASEILNTQCPSTTVEGACASGGLALRAGIMALESGHADVVLVNGVEKMTDIPADKVNTALMAGASEEQELFVGATFAGLNALIAQVYMNEYGLSRQHLAAVSVKNHEHGSNNPLAHFQKKITVNDVLNSSLIASPLTIFDCAPISDGAASLVLSTYEFAQKHVAKNPDVKVVYIVGSGQASDTLSLAKRKCLTEFKATQKAALSAFNMAGIKPQDIDVVELHDGFSITEIISLEDLGFFEKGTAAKATVEGKTRLESQLPVNPSGGLKAKGHPVGATGVSQAYEIVMQLRGECGKRQVDGTSIGLTHNLGGCGATAVVHIFSKD